MSSPAEKRIRELMGEERYKEYCSHNNFQQFSKRIKDDHPDRIAYLENFKKYVETSGEYLKKDIKTAKMLFNPEGTLLTHMGYVYITQTESETNDPIIRMEISQSRDRRRYKIVEPMYPYLENYYYLFRPEEFISEDNPKMLRYSDRNNCTDYYSGYMLFPIVGSDQYWMVRKESGMRRNLVKDSKIYQEIKKIFKSLSN